MSHPKQKYCIDCGILFENPGNKLRCTQCANIANRISSIKAQQKNDRHEKSWIVMARMIGVSTNEIADRDVPDEETRFSII